MAKRVDESAWRREEPELIRGLRARRDDVRAATIQRVCELFDPLVRMLAQNYQHYVPDVEIRDLEQVARVGLLEAIQSFRQQRGAFPTHAMWTIRNALSKYIEATGNPVRLPAWMLRRLAKLSRMQTRLAQRLGREPSRAELAAALRMNESAIDDMRIYNEGPAPLPYEISGIPNSDPKTLRWERPRNRLRRHA